MSPDSGVDGVLGARQVQRVAAPVREQAAEILRDAILDFHFKPGQRLIERELIEQLGVSRTTVREVLRQLSAEGLVASTPQKGAMVMIPSPEDAAELYEVRAVLEALAVRRFVHHATDEQVAELRAALEAYARTTGDAESSLRDMLRAKDRFYEVLLGGAGNREAEAILTGLQARVRLLRASSLSQPGRAEQAVAELRAMVEAIEQRDAEAAARACATHVAAAGQVGAGVLASLSDPDPVAASWPSPRAPRDEHGAPAAAPTGDQGA